MAVIIKYLKTLVTVTLLSWFIISSAQARWAKYEDASLEFKLFDNDIIVNKDGTYEVIVTTKALILKEGGRSSFSSYSFNYNGDSSKVEIIEAKTIYNGKEYVVTQDMIEDKPLASVGQGFDQFKQIIISFPKVELGAEIYLKYKLVEQKIPVDGFYSCNLYYGIRGYWQASTTKIYSKLPLEVKVNDPQQVLKIVNETTKTGQYITITLEKPFYAEVINEPGNGILNVKRSTWVSLSSLIKWGDLAKKLAPGYDRVIKQSLPKMFRDIADLAESKKEDKEKINFITSSLNEKIQYMGDWRSVEGRYFPRDLNKIATSQIGDCKDFTAATAAILKKIGFEVHPILVPRGIYNFFEPDQFLPNIGSFNHVMLKVTSKDKKVYWIDPTNVVSMAGGIYPDIANKLALVLSSSEAGYTKIPDISFQNSKFIAYHELTIDNNIVDEKGQITMQGESAFFITGTGLYYSSEQLRDLVFHTISGVHLNEEEKKNLELPDLTSRIVKDVVIKYELQQKNQLFKTNLGWALTLGSNHWLYKVVDTVPDQISDIFIGTPETREKHMVLKNLTIKNCEKLNFEIDSAWFSVIRRCKYQDKGTEFIDTISIKKSFITNEELKTTEYKNLKTQLDNNFEGASIIISE